MPHDGPKYGFGSAFRRVVRETHIVIDILSELLIYDAIVFWRLGRDRNLRRILDQAEENSLSDDHEAGRGGPFRLVF